MLRKRRQSLDHPGHQTGSAPSSLGRGSFLLDAIARVAVMLPQILIPLEDHILDTAQKARSPSGITRSVH